MKIILLMNLKTIFSIWFKTTVNVLKGKVLTLIEVVVVSGLIPKLLNESLFTDFFMYKSKKVKVKVEIYEKKNPTLEKYRADIFLIVGDKREYLLSIYVDDFEIECDTILWLINRGIKISGIPIIMDEE